MLKFFVLSACVAAIALAENAVAFEGKIEIVVTQGSETTPLLYTVGPNSLRIEVTGSDRPNPIDIIDLKSGAITILFPHNRSFVRLKPGNESRQGATTPPNSVGEAAGFPGTTPSSPTVPKISPPPGAPPVPTPPGGLPPGIGPQSQQSPLGGPPNGAGQRPALPNPQMPPMPMMPPPMSEKIELKPTGKKEKILGFACEQYEIKQRGETMEIWATDKLIPFQNYVRNQPPRFGPRMIEDQWPELLKSRRLFPLRASLRYDVAAMPSSRATEKREKGVAATGPERFRFEVKSITPQKIDDKDGKLFQPPRDYNEIQPLPF